LSKNVCNGPELHEKFRPDSASSEYSSKFFQHCQSVQNVSGQFFSLSSDNFRIQDNETHGPTALHIYAPLAGRLGIFWIKSELEDRAFRYLEYENYQNLKKKIAQKRSERSDSVEKISKNIQKMLNQAGIFHEVQGRYKRFYSIFQKLDRVDNDFERIKDLIAFRVLVKNVDECYAALSLSWYNFVFASSVCIVADPAKTKLYQLKLKAA
jgi:hypothetical protein